MVQTGHRFRTCPRREASTHSDPTGGQTQTLCPQAREASNVFKDLDINTTDPVRDEPASAPALETDIPDWIKKLDAKAPAASQQLPAREEPASTQAASIDVPDWLKGLGQKQEPAAPAAAQEPASVPEELLPDWLKTTGPSTRDPLPASHFRRTACRTSSTDP